MGARYTSEIAFDNRGRNNATWRDLQSSRITLFRRRRSFQLVTAFLMQQVQAWARAVHTLL